MLSSTAAAEAYSDDLSSRLSALIAYYLTNQKQINFWEGIVNQVLDNPDLDWKGWEENIYIPFPPALEPPAPTPPSTTWTVSQVPEAAPAAPASSLAAPSCAKLNLCGVAANLATLLAPSILESIPQFTLSPTGQLISQDGSGVISNDGGSLISQDGSGFHVLAGAGQYVLVDGRAYVVSNDGGSLISQDGSGLIQIPAALNPPNFNSIISDNSEGLFGTGANSLIPPASSLVPASSSLISNIQ